MDPPSKRVGFEYNAPRGKSNPAAIRWMKEHTIWHPDLGRRLARWRGCKANLNVPHGWRRELERFGRDLLRAGGEQQAKSLLFRRVPSRAETGVLLF